VVFSSAASNLVAGDVNGFTDIFVADLETGAMVRLGGDLLTVLPILSADGRTLVFRSFSDGLVEGDYNQHSDLFAVRLPGPESEYRITTILRLATGEVQLVWPASGGRNYRVQTAEDPAGPWIDTDLAVTLEGGQGSSTIPGDSKATAQFFRLTER